MALRSGGLRRGGVTAKCYGGAISRKKKLLEEQTEVRKGMRDAQGP